MKIIKLVRVKETIISNEEIQCTIRKTENLISGSYRFYIKSPENPKFTRISYYNPIIPFEMR